MCGIIGFFSPTTDITFGSLINIAYENKHRGEDHGFGIIDLENKRVLKKLDSIECVKDSKLPASYGRIKQTTGIVTCTMFDQEYYNRQNERYEKNTEKFKEKSSSAVLFHHRKASVGDIVQENVHPITVGKNKYIHNGTVWTIDSLRNWLKIEQGWDFKGETDTEVMGNLIDFFLEKFDGDHDKVYERLVDVVGNFGVIIRVDSNQNVHIYKTGSRNLWFYVKDDQILMISEPIYHIGEYEQLYFMEPGHFEFKGENDFDHEVFTDYTERWKDSMDDWDYAIENKIKVTSGKCGTCAEKKETTLDPYTSDTTRGKYQNICFECWLTAEDNIKIVRKK